MKKNKGFTLIELLAVLVILAIIALIITPIVTNLIKDSRIKAAENAANGLLDAVDVYYGRVILNGNGLIPESSGDTLALSFSNDGTITYTPATPGIELEYNGSKVTGGQIDVTRFGDILIYDYIRINGYYCGWKDYISDRTIKCSEASSDVDLEAPIG